MRGGMSPRWMRIAAGLTSAKEILAMFASRTRRLAPSLRLLHWFVGAVAHLPRRPLPLQSTSFDSTTISSPAASCNLAT